MPSAFSSARYYSHTYFEEDVQPPAVNVDPGEPSAPDALAVFLRVTHMMREYYNKRESLLTARFYDERLTLLPLLGKRVYPAPCEPSKYHDDYDVTILPEGSEFHTCYGRLFWRFGAALQSDVGSSEVYHNLITGMDSRSEVHVTLEKCCGTLRKFETLLPRVIRSLSNRNRANNVSEASVSSAAMRHKKPLASVPREKDGMAV
uniref:Uncharacterized protein n=1 Tax=Coccidioides posadasii RMSCC 3488 TaxID=454284 RepID=A0A0J6F8F7_COCPO|nr:hypothetical protein CPAG_05611 [Coccidioides posadasii RMSCC 3488]